MMEPDSTLSQSSKSDENITVVTESQEKRRKEDTVIGRENDTNNDVAQEAQDSSLITRKPEPETRPISQQQLVDELRSIYEGLVLVETKCIEVDVKHSHGISPETMMFLEKIPHKMIELLQYGKMEPEKTIRIWLVEAQKDPAEVDEKPSTIGAAENLSTTSNDQSTAADNQLTTPEEVSAGSHVSEKGSPQVPNLKDCLSAFQVALELRARELELPESLKLAKLTIEEIGEEGRNMVIDRNGLLDIGYNLVDRLLQDVETAAEKKAKDEEKEKAGRAVMEIVNLLATFAIYKENADANPEETLTSIDETPGDAETQQTPSNGTQRATAIDKSLEEVEEGVTSEKITPPESPEKAAPGKIASLETAETLEKVVKEEAITTQQQTGKDANLPAREPQASPEDADVAAKDLSSVGTMLHDQLQYKKIGSLWFVLINGIWYSSLNVKQLQALIMLHRTLLHEHYDFFLASQHPSASSALKRLAIKYAMPARMWRHGVHSFLNVLRERLPESQEHMDAFIVLAYCFQSLLEETMPAFEEVWIEGKGDLARYW